MSWQYFTAIHSPAQGSLDLRLIEIVETLILQCGALGSCGTICLGRKFPTQLLYTKVAVWGSVEVLKNVICWKVVFLSRPVELMTENQFCILHDFAIRVQYTIWLYLLNFNSPTIHATQFSTMHKRGCSQQILTISEWYSIFYCRSIHSRLGLAWHHRLRLPKAGINPWLEAGLGTELHHAKGCYCFEHPVSKFSRIQQCCLLFLFLLVVFCLLVFVLLFVVCCSVVLFGWLVGCFFFCLLVFVLLFVVCCSVVLLFCLVGWLVGSWLVGSWLVGCLVVCLLACLLCCCCCCCFSIHVIHVPPSSMFHHFHSFSGGWPNNLLEEILEELLQHKLLTWDERFVTLCSWFCQASISCLTRGRIWSTWIFATTKLVSRLGWTVGCTGNRGNGHLVAVTAACTRITMIQQHQNVG